MGDASIWIENISYPGYLFCPEGDCLSIKNNPKKLKPRKKINGYIQWVLNGKDVLSHRIIAEIFCNNEELKNQINHIDGNKENNHYLNLEWCTNIENMRHSINILKRSYSNRRGEKSNFSKLKTEDVIKINEMLKNGCEICFISNMFKVSKRNIKLIKERKTWKHLFTKE